MSDVHTVHYRGGRIEIHADDHAGNPIEDCDELLTIVLHDKAEQHFGWTGDEHYARLLNDGLEQIAQGGRIRNLYGPRGALDVVSRWLKAFHGVTVALPISAIEHSGVAVYLGAGAHLMDPGGWDSGWIGLAIDTPARREVMGFDKPGESPAPGTGKPWNHPETIEWALRGDFDTFASWVANEVYGWIAYSADGDELESCWGYYGDANWAEWAHEGEGDPYMISEAKAVIDADLAAKEKAAAEAAAWAHHTNQTLLRRLVHAKQKGQSA